MDPSAALFFDSHPLCLPLYEAFEEAVLNRFTDVSVRTARTQISFCCPKIFACVSLPHRRIRTPEDAHIIITFGLPCRAESPRIHQSSEPYPNRWTHHLLLHSREEIDEELFRWLDEAYAFARFK